MERFTETIKSGSWKNLEPGELKRLGYAALYYSPQPGELEEVGLSWEEFIAGAKEVRAAIEALDAPRRHRVEMARCNGCGKEVPKNTLMNASLKPGVCPECYDRYSG